MGRHAAPVRGRAAWLVASAVVLGACAPQAYQTLYQPGTRPPEATPSPAPEASPLSLRRAFGPEYPREPATGRAMLSEQSSVLLSPDRRTLYVGFTGGLGYQRLDPCTEDYLPWLVERPDVIEVSVNILAHSDQATLGPNEACTLEGWSNLFSLALPAPFWGDRVLVHGTSTVLRVPSPERVVEATLSRDWIRTRIQVSTNWVGVDYMQGPEISMASPWIDIVQRFAPTERQEAIGDVMGRATIHGQEVPVRRQANGGLGAAWADGPDWIVIEVHIPDLTLEAFVDLANGIGRPGAAVPNTGPSVAP